jgi:SAM-dependent methyltransferase
MAAVAAPTQCPACHIVPAAIPRPIRGYAMVRCPRCGLRWWDFSSIDAAAIYGPDYFGQASGAGYDDYYALRPAIERTGRRRLERIRSRLGIEGGRLLDLGCGPGFFLDVARSAGWSVQGVEISESAARHASDVLGLPVLNAAIDAGVVPRSAFDLVTMWDVIEHVPNPQVALNAAADALRPGGGFVLTTGDVDSLAARLSGERWHLYNLPEHFYFHTEPSVRSLAEQAGLRPVAVRREAMTVSVSYAIERVAKSYLGGAGRRLGHWLPEILFPASLHDVLTLYAVRAS